MLISRLQKLSFPCLYLFLCNVNHIPIDEDFNLLKFQSLYFAVLITF